MVANELLDSVLLQPTSNAWISIVQKLYDNYSSPFTESPVQEIIKREKAMVSIETIIAGAAWDLWYSFEDSVPKTARLIQDFWSSNLNGKAVLIIDGLSMREMPFLIDQGNKRGYTIHQSTISSSALPSDTTFFAKSLGFSSRSELSNNSAGKNHYLDGAVTDCVDLPWEDCVNLISSEPNWVLWHTKFDDLIHEYNGPGKGIRELCNKSEEHFTSDAFWSLIYRLSNGRKVVITSDHGYASTGDFNNITGEQGDYLKATYKSQRYTKCGESRIASTPPLDILLSSENGEFQYVLGRRKWKSTGGYPTLAHGGLSLMETLVPYIEISK
jgi:hypothetical protein